MKSYDFKLKSSKIDLTSIEDKVRSNIQVRKELGVYEHYDFSTVMHYSLFGIKKSSEFLNAHLKAVKSSWAVDINDFEILVKKTGILALIENLFKKIIWKLLKFYTYRIFSQQREFNSQIANAAILMEEEYSKKIIKLEETIEKLK